MSGCRSALFDGASSAPGPAASAPSLLSAAWIVASFTVACLLFSVPECSVWGVDADMPPGPDQDEDGDGSLSVLFTSDLSGCRLCPLRVRDANAFLGVALSLRCFCVVCCCPVSCHYFFALLEALRRH